MRHGRFAILVGLPLLLAAPETPATQLLAVMQLRGDICEPEIPGAGPGCVGTNDISEIYLYWAVTNPSIPAPNPPPAYLPPVDVFWYAGRVTEADVGKTWILSRDTTEIYTEPPYEGMTFFSIFADAWTNGITTPGGGHFERHVFAISPWGFELDEQLLWDGEAEPYLVALPVAPFVSGYDFAGYRIDRFEMTLNKLAVTPVVLDDGSPYYVIALRVTYLIWGDPLRVPEPNSLALLCLGLAGLGLSRRRKTF